MTEWLYRINVIAPTSMTALLNALWTVIAPNGDDESRSFGVPLSPSASEPPTHTGISTAATEEMRVLIREIFDGNLSGCAIQVQNYTVNDWDGLLVSQGLQVIQMRPQ